jgi:hypothetical protein
MKQMDNTGGCLIACTTGCLVHELTLIGNKLELELKRLNVRIHS